jgi:hypothetical protein
LTPPSPPKLLAGPVAGKTYSLYGESVTTEAYYAVAGGIAETARLRTEDPAGLLEAIARAGRSRRAARHAAAVAGSDVAVVFGEAATRLGTLFEGAVRHRATLPVTDRCSATLAMSFEQYLFAAIEIELRNQLNSARFRVCAEKLAFLPHCLRNLDAVCAAKPHGLDVVCRACSDACYVNAASRVLRRHHVQPYLWMNANLGRLLREKATSPTALGVLGIACIPELVAGMRVCAGAGVPVLGLPLDANRCARWFGEFRPNTVNLGRLEALLAGAVREPRPDGGTSWSG